ncbi:MAG TPA: SGNH/GDSL hydrolase family protein [Gemmatimonadales bacterium]|jgi:lysophospholipase L1-like esterase
MTTTRREFLLASAATAAGATLHRHAIDAIDAPVAGGTILFQGDSITDCGRNRKSVAANDPGALGTGYPLLLTSRLREKYPERDLQLFNRGVSGNVVPDLAARWQVDTLDLKPAILSILIGVNDVWHTIGKMPAADVVNRYERGYAALLDQTHRALPQVKIVVLEPFALRTGAVTDAWFPEFDQLRAACRRVADHAGARFVPLHDMLQHRAAKTGAAYWASDGVHPTTAGHEAIADAWAAAVKL